MQQKTKLYHSFYLTNRFFFLLIPAVILFFAGFFNPVFTIIGGIILSIIIIATLYDAWQLYKIKEPLSVERDFAEKLSNGDENLVFITVENQSDQTYQVELLDEIPIQFQQRNFVVNLDLLPQKSKSVSYTVRPTERGRYHFRKLNAFLRSPKLNLSRRKIRFFEDKEASVYPSIIQMKKYEFLAISNQLREYGIKKLRRIGQSQEFEQIREYVLGDDYRNINWKATGRKRELMVNEYIDERSQRVYSIIDMGRVMKMPFEGLTLLDYSINACLALSNVVIKHQNKPGLITFSSGIDSFLPAEKKASQMNRLLETLYAQSTDFNESNYEQLFLYLSKRLKQRSLLLFYTNFETKNAMYRQIKYLRSIAKKHVLVVIFFENTELDEITDIKPATTEQIYIKTIGKKFVYDKHLIVNELNQYGIHTILTKPQELTVNTINKYLELRSRGLIN